jgi:hypothetical protein
MTADQVPIIAPTLTQRQTEYLLASVLGLKTPEQLRDISDANRIKIGIWEQMLALGFVSDAQAGNILNRVAPALLEVFSPDADRITACMPFVLDFVGQRYVTWQTYGNWYDFIQDQDVEVVPVPIITHIVCDVRALNLSQQDRLMVRREIR